MRENISGRGTMINQADGWDFALIEERSEIFACVYYYISYIFTTFYLTVFFIQFFTYLIFTLNFFL